MRQIRSKHPPGTVGYIQANRPRFQGFFDSLEKMVVPGGTALERASNYNAAHNRNELIEGIEGEWIFFLDDDHVWEEDALLRLLDREVDIVTALYCRRYAPFAPTVFKEIGKLYTWQGLSEESGLLEIAACGAGALLVRRKVLEKMARPWFRVGGGGDEINEDINFCIAAREVGFKVHVDLDVQVAHLPDEALLIPMRQPNDAFNIVAKIREAQVWLLQEQERKKLVHLA